MKNKIVSWLKKEVKSSGAKGIVLGLSGGIDSAVVAALAKEAVGASKVLALFMPCHSQAQDLRDARALARKLGIKSRLVDLTGVYDKFLKALPSAGRLCQANLRPRLRMAALYYFASRLNYLVCGTGNKSEISVGYFTKYGDSGADLLPIAGLLKRQVRRLAKGLKIPSVIIEKAPTAGLWPGQTDEGEMGITYEDLDDILSQLACGRKQVMRSLKARRVMEMVRRSAHKRAMPKTCAL
jgi:NAD+ synthase